MLHLEHFDMRRNCPHNTTHVRLLFPKKGFSNPPTYTEKHLVDLWVRHRKPFTRLTVAAAFLVVSRGLPAFPPSAPSPPARVLAPVFAKAYPFAVLEAHVPCLPYIVTGMSQKRHKNVARVQIAPLANQRHLLPNP